MNWVFSILIAIPVLLSCAESSGQTNRYIPKVSNAFKFVKERCEYAGGTFSETTSHCDCGAGKAFSAQGRGKCSKIVDDHDCLGIEGGFSQARRRGNEEACFEIGELGRSVLFVNDLAHDSRESAAWADQQLHKAFTEQSIVLPEMIVDGLGIEIYVGPGSLSQLRRSDLARLINPPYVGLHGRRDSVENLVGYYVHEDENLARLLEVGKFEGEAEVSESRNEFRSLAQRINSVLSAPFRPSDGIFYTDDGCAGHCELIAHHEVRGKRVASRKRRIISGSLFSDEVILWDDSAQVAKALASLWPSGQVSLVHVFDTRERDGQLSRGHRIFDRQWSSLLDRPMNRVVTAKLDDLKQSVFRFENASEYRKPQVVVCESGFQAETLEQVGVTNFVKARESLSDSNVTRAHGIFGWMATPNLSPVSSQFLSGVTLVTELGFRLSNVGNLTQHADIVSRNVIGDKETHVIPMGHNECMEGKFPSQRVRRFSDAKVINISAVHYFEKVACENSAFGKQIASTRNDWLWVVAAGNDGKNGDRTNIHYCPQNLSGMDNLLVVASGTPRSIAHLSNRGKFFADIVAENEYSSSWATSFATPVVSRIAAKIAKAYPRLSIQKVRQALLLGAEIPTESSYIPWQTRLLPLNVRSGGAVSEQNAMAIAKAMNENPRWSEVQLVRNQFCEGTFCTQAEKRIELLQERGVIER